MFSLFFCQFPRRIKYRGDTFLGVVNSKDCLRHTSLRGGGVNNRRRQTTSASHSQQLVLLQPFWYNHTNTRRSAVGARGRGHDINYLVVWRVCQFPHSSGERGDDIRPMKRWLNSTRKLPAQKIRGQKKTCAHANTRIKSVTRSLPSFAASFRNVVS